MRTLATSWRFCGNLRFWVGKKSISEAEISDTSDHLQDVSGKGNSGGDAFTHAKVQKLSILPLDEAGPPKGEPWGACWSRGTTPWPLSSFHHQQTVPGLLSTRQSPFESRIKIGAEAKPVQSFSPTVTHVTPSATRSRAFPLLDFQIFKKRK